MGTLSKVARGLWLVYRTYALLFEKARGKRGIIRENFSHISSCIESISPAMGLKRACRMFGISVQKYYRNKISPCLFSSVNLCKKFTPQQLTLKEKSSIKEYMGDERLLNWPLIARYYQMMWEGSAYMCKQTFNKHCKSFINPLIIIRKAKRKTGIRASRPFEILHIDCSIVRTSDNMRGYIQFITDNFSRYILAYRASLKWDSSCTVENLKAACEKYSLYNKKVKLMCDNGSENEGKVNEFLLQPGVCFKKIIAQTDVVFSNSMAEAVNKKMKYDFLFRQPLENLQSVITCLDNSVSKYNNRYHSALYGYTPSQVLAGYIPNPHLFKSEIEQSRNNRIIQNKKDLCDSCR